MKQGRPGQPEGDDETDLARFLLGRWPAELCKLVEQLPEQEDEESGARPSQALAWAGRHTHAQSCGDPCGNYDKKERRYRTTMRRAQRRRKQTATLM